MPIGRFRGFLTVPLPWYGNSSLQQDATQKNAHCCAAFINFDHGKQHVSIKSIVTVANLHFDHDG